MRRLCGIAIVCGVAIGSLLTACATEQPLGTDLVKDEAAAIQSVKKECVPDWNIEQLQSSRWHAELHEGKWRVRLGHRFCAAFEGTVRAADGETNCIVCVS